MSYSQNPDDGAYYNDTRVECRRSTRPQNVPYSELTKVRSRELDSLQRPRPHSPVSGVRRSGTQHRDRGPYQDTRDPRDDAYYNRRSPGRTRQDSAPDINQIQPSPQSRRTRSSRRDADEQTPSSRSENRDRRARPQAKSQSEQDSNNDRRWFDKSSDGAITAATGAALGAITARHFAGPKDFSPAAESPRGKYLKNWRMIAGAVAGAAALNLGGQALRAQLEGTEHGEDIENGGELCGEALTRIVPDVL